MDEQLEEPQSSTLFETPKITKHKRRNSLDSTRGLSVKGKTSIADMKTVVSNLESDVIEIKYSLSTEPEDNSAKIEHMEDKIIQLENSLKIKVGQLSSRVIDLETDNDILKTENSKLKNEIQSLKKQVKSLDKKTQLLSNIENGKEHTTTDNLNLNWADSMDEKASTSTDLTNNPFNILSEPIPPGVEESSTPVTSSHQKPQVPPEDLKLKDPKYKKNPSEDHHNPEKLKSPITEDDSLGLKGKFVDTNKFLFNKSIEKVFTPTIASATEAIMNKNFGNPSTIVIHTGTNDIEQSSLDSCIDSLKR